MPIVTGRKWHSTRTLTHVPVAPFGFICLLTPVNLSRISGPGAVGNTDVWVLRTNRRRQTMMAMSLYMSPRMRLENRNNAPKWRQLCSLPGSPTRVFFNLSFRGVHRLAVEEPVFRRSSPLLLATSSPYLFSHGTADYFYSSASLEHVVEVTPCQRELATYSPIIGLLLATLTGNESVSASLEWTVSARRWKSTLHISFTLASRGPKRFPPTSRSLNSVRRKMGGRFVGYPYLGREHSSGGLLTAIVRYIMEGKKAPRYSLQLEVRVIMSRVPPRSWNAAARRTSGDHTVREARKGRSDCLQVSGYSPPQLSPLSKARRLCLNLRRSQGRSKTRGCQGRRPKLRISRN
ncbi:hypothetical protein QBC33DRAFT_360211 [Phialemonium atrogriseum]|uniref:Uncharacterized protein n=1 Tax=Phialemonium atrogriseum TaxID=1093897 RepID=A0AAJ0FHP0_9PEZI|nr:uncharacterized protein QBC33DRAFT_360211 [Phialemonium atrogriseum]KAK1768791.1 hypothetical protein QBC33DRAFT_360211 [Phialemonium atrogriseum]